MCVCGYLCQSLSDKQKYKQALRECVSRIGLRRIHNIKSLEFHGLHVFRSILLSFSFLSFLFPFCFVFFSVNNLAYESVYCIQKYCVKRIPSFTLILQRTAEQQQQQNCAVAVDFERIIFKEQFFFTVH